jgi:hypothetical protein
VRLFSNACVSAALVVLSSTSVFAQETGRWEPMGPIPVDQAGAGRRGYVMSGEGSDVLQPRETAVSIHMVGANNFYMEDASGFAFTQRSESHTLAVDYRRGFTTRWLPRVEFGAQVQISESDSGMLNGFISGFEDLVHAPLRSKSATVPPLGTSVVRDGRALYQSPGAGAGIGDLTLVAKAPLHEGIAARVVVNVSGASEFTEGNFAGMGVSLDRTLNAWVAFHGDVRATVPLDRVSTWSLPLRRAALGFSAGPEVRLGQNTSLNLQWDGSTTPYEPTGVIGFDAHYADIALGINRRFQKGRRQVVARFYARENMVMPFNVRWTTDPDLAIGMKATLR